MTRLGSRLVAAAAMPSIIAAASNSTSSPCETLAQSAQNLVKSNGTSPRPSADLAYACLQSIPLNQSLALNFTTEYKAILQYQSTVDFLKSPPSTYQQPAVDLLGGLDNIIEGLKSGQYSSDWEWESAIQTLIGQAHDGHLYLTAGAWANVFNFEAPLELVSLSMTGKDVPKIYSRLDIIKAQRTSNASWTPSALTSINGVDTIQWLQGFSKNLSQGLLDANAEWNGIMYSAVGNIAGQFAGLSTYDLPQGSAFVTTYENGTRNEEEWAAIPAGTLSWNEIANMTSGADYYSQFVVAQPTPTSASSSTSPSESATPTTQPKGHTAWPYAAYPQQPSMTQPNLGGGQEDSGWLTGYQYPEASLGVISIPSFDMVEDAVDTYVQFIEKFLQDSKAAGVQKILIDVSSNGGGDALLSTETFKLFFPQLQPFGGSNQRAFEGAQLLGSTLTENYNQNKMNASFVDHLHSLSINWIAPLFIDAGTGEAFDDWESYFGPEQASAGLVTVSKQANFSNVDYDSISTAQPGFVVAGFANATKFTSSPLYAAEDVALLTDGICASTCSVFVELFHHQAGVPVVTVGGVPRNGPMQGASGVRGAQSYSIKQLSGDIENAVAVNNSLADALPSLSSDFNVAQLSFNLWNQVRENDTMPRQFAYDPADCRIWATPETFNNYTNLWQYAARAIWQDSSLCVPGSTNQTSSGSGNSSVPTNSTGSAAPSTTASVGVGPRPTSSLQPYQNAASSTESANALFGLSVVLAAIAFWM